MHVEGAGFIRRAVVRLADEIRGADFDVKNETELGHLFFATCWAEAKDNGVPLRSIRSEVRLRNRGRIDFGIQSSLFLELKVWIRPLNVGHMSKANAQTWKRNACIKDALRLSRVICGHSDRHAWLLVLERNSSHLQRRLGLHLKLKGLPVEEEWIALKRQSKGKHDEHIGLLSIYPNDHSTANARTSGATVA
jgi:hypothetical protein